MNEPTSRIEEYLAQAPAPKQHIHPKLGALVGEGRFVSGEGTVLVDADGNRTLDLIGGGGTTFLGRNHPRVTRACRDLLEMDLPNLSIVNASLLGGQVAGMLLERTNGQMGKVIYANSGTESTDVMIRFARFVTKRRRFLYLQGGFHGRSFGAISVCGFPELREGAGPFMPECTAIKPNDLRALRRELKQGDVAGFILEPVQRLTGLALDRGYMREAEILCRQAGVLLLADESHSGLGRTGHWFRTTGLGIRPDMMSVSSVLSGGAVPVAAVMMTDKVYNDVYTSLTSGPIYFSTFAENNMAMTAAMTTLDVLDELDAPALATQRSNQLRARLTELAEAYDVIDHLGGDGLLLSIHFGRSATLADAGIDTPDSQMFAAAMAHELFTSHRVALQLAGPGINALIALPPVTITDDEMIWFTDAVESVLKDLYAGKSSILDIFSTLEKSESLTGLLAVPQA